MSTSIPSRALLVSAKITQGWAQASPPREHVQNKRHPKKLSRIKTLNKKTGCAGGLGCAPCPDLLFHTPARMPPRNPPLMSVPMKSTKTRAHQKNRWKKPRGGGIFARAGRGDRAHLVKGCRRWPSNPAEGVNVWGMREVGCRSLVDASANRWETYPREGERNEQPNRRVAWCFDSQPLSLVSPTLPPSQICTWACEGRRTDNRWKRPCERTYIRPVVIKSLPFFIVKQFCFVG